MTMELARLQQWSDSGDAESGGSTESLLTEQIVKGSDHLTEYQKAIIAWEGEGGGLGCIEE